MERSILSVKAQDKAGVLLKVLTVISGRGINIHAVSACPDSDPSFTRIKLDFLGEKAKVRQVRLQLEKLEVVEEVEILESID